MHPLTPRRRSPLAAAFLVLAVGAIAPAGADSPALTTVSSGEGADLASVDCKTSRMVGFAPLLVEVTGVPMDAGGREMSLPDGRRATLVLESSNLSFGSGARQQAVFSGEGLQLPGAGDGGLSRRLVIHEPGTYTLKWIVRDGDRETVISDEVRIRVL